jgi:hypothetical protein
MKMLLLLVGIVVLALGILFMGQGSGYIPWPSSSFMVRQSEWVYYGGAIAVIGILLITFSRR